MNLFAHVEQMMYALPENGASDCRTLGIANYMRTDNGFVVFVDDNPHMLSATLNNLGQPIKGSVREYDENRQHIEISPDNLEKFADYVLKICTSY